MITFYTAIVGDYDTLPTFKRYYPTEARYVCFTDQSSLGYRLPWEVLPLLRTFDDPKVTTGYHKANSQLLFNLDNVTVWVDANLKDINLSPERVMALFGGNTIAAMRHKVRCSVAEEMQAVFELGLDQDGPRIEELRRMMRLVGYPDQQLSACGLLIRDLSDPRVQQFERDWWRCISTYSKRDQLSFDFTAYMNDLDVVEIPVNWWEPNEIFTRVPHKA